MVLYIHCNNLNVKGFLLWPVKCHYDNNNTYNYTKRTYVIIKVIADMIILRHLSPTEIDFSEDQQESPTSRVITGVLNR